MYKKWHQLSHENKNYILGLLILTGLLMILGSLWIKWQELKREEQRDAAYYLKKLDEESKSGARNAQTSNELKYKNMGSQLYTFVYQGGPLPEANIQDESKKITQLLNQNNKKFFNIKNLPIEINKQLIANSIELKKAIVFANQLNQKPVGVIVQKYANKKEAQANQEKNDRINPLKTEPELINYWVNPQLAKEMGITWQWQPTVNQYQLMSWDVKKVNQGWVVVVSPLVIKTKGSIQGRKVDQWILSANKQYQLMPIAYYLAQKKYLDKRLHALGASDGQVLDIWNKWVSEPKWVSEQQSYLAVGLQTKVIPVVSNDWTYRYLLQLSKAPEQREPDNFLIAYFKKEYQADLLQFFATPNK